MGEALSPVVGWGAGERNIRFWCRHVGRLVLWPAAVRANVFLGAQLLAAVAAVPLWWLDHIAAASLPGADALKKRARHSSEQAQPNFRERPGEVVRRIHLPNIRVNKERKGPPRFLSMIKERP